MADFIPPRPRMETLVLRTPNGELSMTDEGSGAVAAIEAEGMPLERGQVRALIRWLDDWLEASR